MPSLRPVRRRPRRISSAKTSSNDDRCSLTDTTEPPAGSTSAMTIGVVVRRLWSSRGTSGGPAGEPASIGGATGRSARIERSAVVDLEHLAAECLVAERVGWREREQPSTGDERDGVTSLRFADVLGGHDEGPAVVPQAIQLVQIVSRSIGSMPAVGSSRKTRVGSWTSADAELQAALHAARQSLARRWRTSQKPSNSRTRGSPPAPPEQQSEHAGHEIHVLRRGEVAVERELLGHEADGLARPAAESRRILAEHPDLALGRQRFAGHQAHGRRLARTARTDDPDEPAGLHGEVEVSQGGQSPKRRVTPSKRTTARRSCISCAVAI